MVLPPATYIPTLRDMEETDPYFEEGTLKSLVQGSTPLPPGPGRTDLTPIGVYPFKKVDWQKEQDEVNGRIEAYKLPIVNLYCHAPSPPDEEQSILVRLAEVLTQVKLMQDDALLAPRFTEAQTDKIWRYCHTCGYRRPGEPRPAFPIQGLGEKNDPCKYRRLLHKLALAMMWNFEIYNDDDIIRELITDFHEWSVGRLPKIMRRCIVARARSQAESAN